MKAGDLVRFKGKHAGYGWRIGLLVEYHTWEKVASIFYEGEVIRVRAENCQKAGKKDAFDYTLLDDDGYQKKVIKE